MPIDNVVNIELTLVKELQREILGRTFKLIFSVGTWNDFFLFEIILEVTVLGLLSIEQVHENDIFFTNDDVDQRSNAIRIYFLSSRNVYQFIDVV